MIKNTPGQSRAVRWQMARRTRLLAVCAVIVALAQWLPVSTAGATMPSGPAFTGSKSVSRVHYVNGADSVVDSRTVTIQVSTTTKLRDRQGITVSWSGARPTAGLAVDDTSPAGAFEEYPVVVMQCRGVDSSTASPDRQVTPQTCWTQTPNERFGYSSTTIFPSFRMDRYATPSDRDYAVNQPSPLPTACSGFSAEHWVPFVGASGTVYPGGYQGCGGAAPEEQTTETSLQPGSTTYGITDLHGNGSTTFILQSDLENASLGCSSAVACTLEVIPIEGISCDPAGAAPAPLGMIPGEAPPSTLIPRIQSECTSTGAYAPGDFNTAGAQDFTPVTGQYWWSASNWRNRIAVPLNFAQSSNVCDASSAGRTAELIYGSETMNQATQQWEPAFCLNPQLFTLRDIQTPEPEAKNLLSIGNVSAAFEAAPPSTPFQTPTVQAPTAITGFAIAYKVDGADKHPYPQLRLNARLLAKLMTESYEACALDCLKDSALATNPIDVTRDPEFQALNPGVPPTNYLSAGAAIALTSAESDVMTALTSYINADPEARSWLDGNPDPWGMRVNPAYDHVVLPVSRWPLQDTHIAQVGSANPCVNNVAWLPLVASPVEDPAKISLNLQYDIDNAQLACTNPGTAVQKLVAVGRESLGFRFLLGVVSLADAVRYDLPTAALQTQQTGSFDPQSQPVFTTANGRSFAAPTAASLRAATAMLSPDDTQGTWTLPYDAMRTQPSGRAAYPGTLLISTDIPTQGLPKQDAQNLAHFLDYAASSGQVQGLDNGQLPAGYLPITAANGLSSLLHYTALAAGDVATQQCVIPYPSGKAQLAPSCNLPTPARSTGSSGSSGGPGMHSGATPSSTLGSTTAPTTTHNSASTRATPSPSSIAAAPVSAAPTFSAGLLGLALPILAGLSLTGFGLSALLSRRGRRG